MIVHTLEFDTTSELMQCFERVSDEPQVEDCMVERQLRRLRFLAPEGLSDGLVERVYLDGGLRWCSRHRLSPTPAPGG